MGLSNGGLRPLSATCAQLSTIVHFCGLFGPLSKGNFRHKMTTIVGNRGQLWTSTLSPHLESPHLRLSCANRVIRANRANGFARITPLSSWVFHPPLLLSDFAYCQTELELTRWRNGPSVVKTCVSSWFISSWFCQSSHIFVSVSIPADSRCENSSFTLPALQTTLVIFFFEFAWEFCIEKMVGTFGEIFSGLPLPRDEARKLNKFEEHSEQNWGQNSGREFGELLFCNFADLKVFICASSQRLLACNGNSQFAIAKITWGRRTQWLLSWWLGLGRSWRSKPVYLIHNVA